MSETSSLSAQIGIIGYYSLHLYCSFYNPEHRHGEFPKEYTDEYGSKCRMYAKRDGWTLYQNGVAMCPKCTKLMVVRKPNGNEKLGVSDEFTANQTTGPIKKKGG